MTYTISKNLRYETETIGQEFHIYKVDIAKKKETKTELYRGKGTLLEVPICHDAKQKGNKIIIIDAVALRIDNPLIGRYFIILNGDGKHYMRKSAGSIIDISKCKGKYRKPLLEKLK